MKETIFINSLKSYNILTNELIYCQTNQSFYKALYAGNNTWAYTLITEEFALLAIKRGYSCSSVPNIEEYLA